MTKESDHSLVRQCLDGDIEAYSQLVDRYQHAVYNAALGIVKNPDDAYDCAQTAFVKAFEKLSSFDPKYKFFSWLYRITINSAIDVVKQQQAVTDDTDQIQTAVDSPSTAYEKEELRTQIDESLMELTLTYRMAIVLRHYAELSYDEMSYVLDIPVKTVKSRLFEARRALGKVLTKRGVVTDG